MGTTHVFCIVWLIDWLIHSGHSLENAHHQMLNFWSEGSMATCNIISAIFVQWLTRPWAGYFNVINFSCIWPTAWRTFNFEARDTYQLPKKKVSLVIQFDRYALNAPDMCYWHSAALKSFTCEMCIQHLLQFFWILWIPHKGMWFRNTKASYVWKQLLKAHCLWKNGLLVCILAALEATTHCLVALTLYYCAAVLLWQPSWFVAAQIGWSCRYAARIWLVSLARFVKTAQRTRGAQEQLPNFLHFGCWNFCSPWESLDVWICLVIVIASGMNHC